MLQLLKHAVNLVRHSLRDVGTGAKRSGKWPTVEKHFLEQSSSCSACGSKKRLAVHHCMPFHLDSSLELDTNNLITLCMSFNRECHLLIGHARNYKLYNPNVKTDAAEVLANPEKFDEIVARAKQNAKVN